MRQPASVSKSFRPSKSTACDATSETVSAEPVAVLPSLPIVGITMGIDSSNRSSRRAVVGRPSRLGRPASMSLHQHSNRLGKSYQETSSIPGSTGPLRRRPSTRLEATETIRSSGQRLESSTASRNAQRPGQSAARIAIDGSGPPDSESVSIAACGEQALTTFVRLAIHVYAMPSSKPAVAPIHSRCRLDAWFKPKSLAMVLVGLIEDASHNCAIFAAPSRAAGNDFFNR